MGAGFSYEEVQERCLQVVSSHSDNSAGLIKTEESKLGGHGGVRLHTGGYGDHRVFLNWMNVHIVLKT